MITTPIINDCPDDRGAGGMSLRDYFAAAAMQGYLASWEADQVVTVELLTDIAYQVADAMLKQRDKK